MGPRASLFLASAVLTVLATPSAGSACSTCGSGDPTLTAVGVEQPFAGRVRVSLGVSQLSYAEGSGAAAVSVIDQRAILGVAVSPTEWLTLSGFVPVVRREVEHATLARETTLGLGDSEARARFIVFRDRAFAPEHLVSVQLGLRIPTPTALRDGSGALLSLDAQTGTGSWDPMLGAMWSVFGTGLAMHTSALLAVPTEGTGGWRNGVTVRLSWQGQWQPSNVFALMLGADARIDAEPALGADAQEGGGAAVFLSPGISIAPSSDVLLWLIVRAPLVQVLGADRSEGPIAELGMAIDA